MNVPVSACIICFNEERKIRRCIESVKWCSEIVILDSFSTDRTLSICREYTDNVHQHEWLGYVGQRNLVRQLAREPWLLFLDSDEEVSPELRDEILREFESGPGPVVGYEFPRMVRYLGRWIRHGEWYPDLKLRLFHRDYGRSEGQEPHDRVVVSGVVKRLRHPLWHYTYDDVEDHLLTLNRFSTITAQQKYVGDIAFRWTDLIFRPMLRFLKGYLLRGGFLDGAHGFMVAVLSAMGAAMKYIKLWEINLDQGDEDAPEPARQPGEPVEGEVDRTGADPPSTA